MTDDKFSNLGCEHFISYMRKYGNMGGKPCYWNVGATDTISLNCVSLPHDTFEIKGTNEYGEIRAFTPENFDILSFKECGGCNKHYCRACSVNSYDDSWGDDDECIHCDNCIQKEYVKFNKLSKSELFTMYLEHVSHWYDCDYSYLFTEK